MRLLLLEDDSRLGPLVARGLRGAGHTVDLTGSVEEARWFAADGAYDAFVFDVVVPDGDGRTLCADLRAAANWTPCLLLTARDAIEDRVTGLDAGADDYLVKPFAFDELLARLRAIARREPIPRPTVLQVGSLLLDPATHAATVAGSAIHVSSREFAVLELLARCAEQVVSRATILDRVWDWAYEGASNVVDVHVHRIRDELRRHPSAPRIETVRGVGYALTAGPDGA